MIDEAPILMHQFEIDALPEYSCTLPTGTTIGKQWVRDENAYCHPNKRTPYPRLILGEYVASEEPGMVGIRWTRIMTLNEEALK